MHKILLFLMCIVGRGGELILTPSQDPNAIKYHLFMSVGTNDFMKVSTVGTNEYFHFTNDFVGKVRFYLITEDEEGNTSEPSDIIKLGGELKKPTLILHQTGPRFNIYPWGIPDSVAVTNLAGSSRAILQQKHFSRMARKSIQLPPPPLP